MGRVGIVVALIVAVVEGRAGAQDCVPAAPDLYPAEGAAAVPVNGVVRVVFHQTYDVDLPLGEALRLLLDDSERPVPGEVTETQDGTDTRLELQTDAPLEPETRYRAVVVLPEGAGEQEFGFRTGTGLVDEDEPRFTGPKDIRVVPADNVACADPDPDVPAEEGDDDRGYRVTVSFDPAADAAGAANIDYLLIQTQGPDIEEPVFRKRVRAAGSGELFGAVFLPHSAVARQEICFQVHAEDMFGNRTTPTHEACGDPIGPGYFRSICAAAGPPPAAPDAPIAGAVLLGGAVLSLTARRRSRRRP